jgi:hypothetical protein
VQACVSEAVAMHWPSMCEPLAATQKWRCGLLPLTDTPPPLDALMLSPLHWLVLAGARAIPCSLSGSQLNQLFQDALCCVPEGSLLADMPRLPDGALGAASTPCSTAVYILKQCVLLSLPLAPCLYLLHLFHLLHACCK